MPKAWSAKDERQYKHIKAGELRDGRAKKVAQRIAAATVNKRRASEGRTKQKTTRRSRARASSR